MNFRLTIAIYSSRLIWGSVYWFISFVILRNCMQWTLVDHQGRYLMGTYVSMMCISYVTLHFSNIIIILQPGFDPVLLFLAIRIHVQNEYVLFRTFYFLIFYQRLLFTYVFLVFIFFFFIFSNLFFFSIFTGFLVFTYSVRFVFCRCISRIYHKHSFVI